MPRGQEVNCVMSSLHLKIGSNHLIPSRIAAMKSFRMTLMGVVPRKVWTAVCNMVSYQTNNVLSYIHCTCKIIRRLFSWDLNYLAYPIHG